MRRIILFFLICSILLAQPALADIYSFDVTEFEQKELEIGFRLDFRPAFSWLEPDSRLFRLTLADDGIRRNQSLFSILAGTTGSYKTGNNSSFIFDGLLTMNRTLGKTRDSQVFNEAWMRFDIDNRLQIGVGKKAFKWGKGYIFNPVNFFGRQKDLNDIDLALAGYTMLTAQHSRTLDGYLSAVTLTTALMPVTKDLNDDFTTARSLNFASQLYMLLGDTDMDFYLMAGSGGNHKFGADFSRNLSSNHEIHAEIAHEIKDRGLEIRTDGRVLDDSRRSTSFLAGTRYLDQREITYILEYIHNGSGFNQTEMQNFFDAADKAIAGTDTAARKRAAQTFTQYINRQFTMRDYLYLKASKPELFGNLYLNGAAFTVYNMADSSCSTSFELNYTGMTDNVITLRLTSNRGNKNSEYGQKLNSDKVELRYQYFF